jgi:hypothetical protein
MLKKIILILFSSSTLLSVNQVLADSVHLIPGGLSTASALKWTSSISESYLTSYVVPSANSWNNISSRVSLTRVTSGAYQVRILTGTNAVQGYVGAVYPYCAQGAGRAICNNQNWTSAQLTGYTNQISAMNLNTSQIIGTVYAHEFGHVLSLEHNDTISPSVMTTSSIVSFTAQQTDKDHLKQKWGN